MNGREKMNYVQDWEKGTLPVSLARNDRALPLLLTIIISVLAGILGAALALKAGYGVIAAMSCYVFVGVLVSFVLPLAYHKTVPLGPRSNPKEFGQLWSEGAVSSESDKLDQHFLSELDWLENNTALELAKGSSIMFVAGETKEARDIRESLVSGPCFTVRETRSLRDAVSIILEAPERWNMLCIDVDPVGGVVDLDTSVEQLISFREVAPRVPVMLMSRSFSLDPFHLPDRPSIADCNLRIPASGSRVLRALKDTYINNLIWRSCLEISPA